MNNENSIQSGSPGAGGSYVQNSDGTLRLAERTQSLERYPAPKADADSAPSDSTADAEEA